MVDLLHPYQGYVFGALAIIFYIGVMFVNPLRANVRAGRLFVKDSPLTWFVIGLMCAHQGWWVERKMEIDFSWPTTFSPPPMVELVMGAVVDAANSLVSALLLPVYGEPLSVVLAVALVLNVGGISAAMRKGCETAFPKRGAWGFAILLCSALANLAWFGGLVFEWWPESGGAMIVLHAIGLLWSGATVAFVLAWLVRLAETYFLAPEETLQISWSGSAAGRVPRLWPVIFMAVALQLWTGFTHHPNNPLVWIVRVLGWILAISMAFLPLLLVHWRGEWAWATALRAAFHRLLVHWPKLLIWLVLGSLHFFLFHLFREWIELALPTANIWRLGWNLLSALLHAVLVVWMLATWVAFQPAFEILKTPFAPESKPDR